ncbi:hypothetical protein FA13DRAFT_1731048 [Coprinellus micaceus]|uniref:Uncharacterized protein n=1 Tax=Coprinellus micaceus TaxID=71717 RepID=A0A4Y7TH75_COPMI|nr:hypothetical protein FA13DRAFT_1731048 [Coprinellus micaceus]
MHPPIAWSPVESVMTGWPCKEEGKTHSVRETSRLPPIEVRGCDKRWSLGTTSRKYIEYISGRFLNGDVDPWFKWLSRPLKAVRRTGWRLDCKGVQAGNSVSFRVKP